MEERIVVPLVILLARLILGEASFLSTGVPCYLHPSIDGCHYKLRPESDSCTTPAQRQSLVAKIIVVNRTLLSLEHQLIRLGIIPPDNACSKLPPVENGGIIYDDLNLAPGATGRYTCYEGYTLVSLDEDGRYEYTCTEEGIWDGSVTTVPVKCQLSSKKCNPPEGIENGTIAYINNDSSNTLLGDMITYTCLPGHDLKGDAERYCLRTGNWSGDDPFCIQYDDDKPSEEHSGVRKPIIIGSVIGSTLPILFLLMIIIISLGVAAYYFKRKHKSKYYTLQGSSEDNTTVPEAVPEAVPGAIDRSKSTYKTAYQVVKDVNTAKGSGKVKTTQGHRSYRSTHSPLLENEDENTF